jgi:hypothetical protein
VAGGNVTSLQELICYYVIHVITERIEYYHINCFERIIPDLADLVRGERLKTDAENGCLDSSPARW